jgi:DNA-binding MarR family transcriptional regulator
MSAEHLLDRPHDRVPTGGGIDRLAANPPSEPTAPSFRASANTSLVPPAPSTVDGTGLTRLALSDHVMKAMLQHGLQHLQDLAAHTKLPPSVIDEVLQPLRREALVETRRRGATDGDISYDLTQLGRARAGEALTRCQYTGPAPVPLDAYIVQTQLQSVANMRVSEAALDAALSGVVLRDDVREQLGAALNSRRAVMLYGPPGAGKSYLCHKIAAVMHGPVAIPHAIDVGGEIIRVFDPLVHRPLGGERAASTHSALDMRAREDQRWVVCARPVVITGGELTLEMLDLVYDARAGYYQAPPHVKANNGLYLVDDLGRQLVTPRQLLNRWIVPMEMRHDYLMLRNGNKFKLPFDTALFFSTNLAPTDVADEAFLRRIGYKILIGEMPLDRYRRIFDEVCVELGVKANASAFDSLIQNYHEREHKPRLACYPRDLVRQVVDHAAYHGQVAELSPAMLDWAWHNYFASRTDSASSGASPTNPTARSAGDTR